LSAPSLTIRSPEDTAYTLRIHLRHTGPAPVAFDGPGNSVSMTNLPGRWQYFQITVPTNALGWDVQLTNVTAGYPQMVVSRDMLPTALDTSVGWVPSYWYPQGVTNWLSALQWLSGDAWNGCGDERMLAMGMGNPLEAGTYYIGVQDANKVSSYTLQSRGIGLTNHTIRVHDLSFNGSANN